MSLINKMLQELDARGTPAGGAFQVPAKAVEREPSRLDLRARLAGNARVIGVVAAGSLAGVALAWSGWSLWQHRHAAAARPAAPATASAGPVAATAAPVVAAPSAVPAAPPAATVQTAPTAPAPVIPATPVPAPVGAAADTATPAALAEPRAGDDRTARRKDRHDDTHQDSFGAAAAPSVRGSHPKSVAPLEPDSEQARAVRRALARELDARSQAREVLGAAGKPRKPSKAPVRIGAQPAAAGVAADAAQEDSLRAAPPGRQESAGQRAESQYRRALASMQEGRMGETIAALEAALRIDPAHEAARQTLVGLLVEAGRPDEAARQLQLGLSLDPRQPAMAMLLARLQIERGDAGLQSGIDTLARTLPFAGNDPDYRALLAGALQRQGRHREAAEHYAQALKGGGKAVWWMGMGISLQADKRGAEALDAFRKARAGGLPSQELQAFVERRIQQLER